MAEIDVVAAEPALGEDDGDVGGKLGLARCRRVDHHARQARRQRQFSQPPPFLGDASRLVDRMKLAEQRLCLRQRRRRRQIEKRELRGVGDAPMGEVEHEAGKIGGENFRPVGRLERGGLRLVPQPIADAGLSAPGAAAALVGGGARDPHGLEPGEPHVGLVARHPREPAIDHHPHAFDGQRGLRDRGREHDLAPAGRRRRDRPVLHVGVERTVKRHDVDGAIADALAQERLGAADLGGAGKKDQERSGLRPQRAHDGVGDLRLDREARVAPKIAGLDREGAAGALDRRRVAEELADARAVERCRHDQELELGAQALLHVARQRQAEVAVERALVELVE